MHDLVVANDADFNDDTGRIDIHRGSGQTTSFLVIGFDGSDDEVAVGKLVGDTKAEMVVADAFHGTAEIFDAQGERLDGFGSSFDGNDSFALADVDRDGLDDLVVGNAEENGRLDVIDPVTNSAAGKGSAFDDDDALAVGDALGDGAEEIVVANTEENGRVDVFDGRIDFVREFDSAYNSGDDLTLGAFGTGDLDTDGIPDKVELNGIDHRSSRTPA